MTDEALILQAKDAMKMPTRHIPDSGSGRRF